MSRSDGATVSTGAAQPLEKFFRDRLNLSSGLARALLESAPAARMVPACAECATVPMFEPIRRITGGEQLMG